MVNSIAEQSLANAVCRLIHMAIGLLSMARVHFTLSRLHGLYQFHLNYFLDNISMSLTTVFCYVMLYFRLSSFCQFSVLHMRDPSLEVEARELLGMLGDPTMQRTKLFRLIHLEKCTHGLRREAAAVTCRIQRFSLELKTVSLACDDEFGNSSVI